MKIDGSPKIPPPPQHIQPARRVRQIAPQENTIREEGKQPPQVHLTERERTMLNQLFNSAVSPSQKYQMINQNGQRVHLGQYIDTRA